MPEPIFPINQAQESLKAGRSLIGVMVVEMRQPSVMQLLVNAGYDYVIIDNEHGPFSIETIADLSRAARWVGLTPIVRVPDLAYPYLAQSLDSGAQGVMLPRIYTREQVEQAVQIMKYPPLGQRGCAFNRGHSDFKSLPVQEGTVKANEETMLVVQIETKEAVDDVEGIISVPGVDVALVGPGDLSIALGVPGQMNAPILHKAIEKVIDTCEKKDVYPAIHINALEDATYWAEKGMRMVSGQSETSLMIQAGTHMTNGIRAAFG
ncbi:MAG: aldolase/citrate lyase family protein [Chloroflexota bacterium]